MLRSVRSSMMFYTYKTKTIFVLGYVDFVDIWKEMLNILKNLVFKSLQVYKVIKQKPLAKFGQKVQNKIIRNYTETEVRKFCQNVFLIKT